jgi:hypothetical protein
MLSGVLAPLLSSGRRLFALVISTWTMLS